MCDFCENVLKKDAESGFCISGGIGVSWYGYGLDNVKFCPVCGRKLSEETEKPRTKEVIERIKEKMTEDDYMELKDNEKSFDDCFDGLLSILNDEKEPLPFDDEQDLEELILELEDQHMSDCITINRLNATIDILLDRYANLREMRGV